MRSHAAQHPTGLTAMGTTVLVWLLSALGVDMPDGVAASIVGLAAAMVSQFTPRNV